MSSKSISSSVGINIGNGIDEILNFQPSMSHLNTEKPSGLILPSDTDPGTGNIIIFGRPGTGKSTLAMQIAVACVKSPNKGFFSAYISMEEHSEHICKKAEKYGWKDNVLPLVHLSDINDPPSQEELGRELKYILTANDCPQWTNRCTKSEGHNHSEIPRSVVLLPTLPPRSITSEAHENSSDMLFWDRYRQMERLLIASAEENGNPRLSVVCIDSLNVFSDSGITRDQLFMIFDLFKRYKVIGIFIVEEDYSDKRNLTNTSLETMEYLSDTVIRLSSEEDQGYMVRLIEVVKSRNSFHVRGKHPFTIYGENDQNKSQTGLIVHPSVFYQISRLSRADQGNICQNNQNLNFGITGLTKILPKTLKENSIIAITGPKGTFKTTLALNYLFYGCKIENQTTLLIRFGDYPIPIGECKKIKGLFNTNEDVCEGYPESRQDNSRYLRREWSVGKGKIIEFAFKSGTVLPEQLIDAVTKEIESNINTTTPIKRIVFGDVSLIGINYPFLNRSQTASDFFPTAMINIIRSYKYGISMVVTGSYSGAQSGDQIVSKISSLADTVLNCTFCDVFGDRKVVIRGDGLTAATGLDAQTSSEELAPGVIKVVGDNSFEIDTEYLEGLVGFDTGNVHRPGLSLHLFQEAGDIHKKYNKELLQQLEFLYPDSKKESVSVVTFDATMSSSARDSLRNFENSPLDRTVVCTIDEFWDSPEQSRLVKLPDTETGVSNNDFATYITSNGNSLPYIANVLLLAFRTDFKQKDRFASIYSLLRPNGNHQPRSWEDVSKALEQYTRIEEPDSEPILPIFDCDVSPSETLSCLLLDALSLGATDIAPFNNGTKLFSEPNTSNWVSQCNEVSWLQKILRSMPTNVWTRPAGEIEQLAGIRVCWYSQLRDMINKHPKLAGSLDVCGLPGGGFKGDWFAGIKLGSVSVKLGMTVLQAICNKSEEYKRFTAGVGLPTSRCYEEKAESFKAWPHSGITLQSIIQIHKGARYRANIDGYKEYGAAFSQACRELACSEWVPDDTSTTKRLLQELIEQIGVLK